MKTAFIMATIAAVAALLGTVAMPLTQALAAPAYTATSSPSVTSNPSEKVYKFSITAGDDIPHVADEYVNSVLVFGYAWLAPAGTGANAVVATIHPVAGKDSTQNPNNWHAHTAVLIPTADCPGSLQVTDLKSPTAGIAINGDTMTVTMKAGSAIVSPSTFGAATGFQLVAGSNQALCVAAP